MVYLFVHVIWSVQGREALLTRPVRKVLFVHMQKEGEEKGIKILAVGGVEDHVHCLLQLMPSQNLLQVLRSIRVSAADWLNATLLLTGELKWEEGFMAYSVSPSGVKQVVDYMIAETEHGLFAEATN